MCSRVPLSKIVNSIDTTAAVNGDTQTLNVKSGVKVYDIIDHYALHVGLIAGSR